MGLAVVRDFHAVPYRCQDRSRSPFAHSRRRLVAATAPCYARRVKLTYRRQGRSQESAGPMVKSTAAPSDDVGESVPAARRHERIAEMVLRQPFVAAKDLARLFDVSLMTIHRDLDELEHQGLLRKVRGGATPQPSSLFESNVRYRMTMAEAEKQALARFALGQIEPGQAVMLDESTTCLALARLLPA